MTEHANRRPVQGPTNLILLPASQFSLEALTDIYNRSRSDYLVPMSMTAERMSEYMRIYHVNLAHSWVVSDGEGPIGIGMLGIRQGRGWLTRLGVVPGSRKHGAGQTLLEALLANASELGLRQAILEVISGNTPAHALFQRMGFNETRRLLVLKRPSGALPSAKTSAETSVVTRWLDLSAAASLLTSYPEPLPWTNQVETYLQASDGEGLEVEAPEEGIRAWLVFRRQARMLSHFVLHTICGNPVRAGDLLLTHLYRQFPDLESSVENVVVTDPHLHALWNIGFVEAFRRIEMVRLMNVN